MKKLMIAAAIVCAAAMSQASTINWNSGIDFSADPNWDDYTYGSAWLVQVASTDLTGLGVDKDGNIVLGTGMSLVESNSEVSDPISTISDGTLKSFSTEASSTALYALVVWDEDYEKWGVLGAYEITPSDPDPRATDDVSFKTLAGGITEFAVTNDPVGVPEPTSGLLLLLGVAGLALRRRRA